MPDERNIAKMKKVLSVVLVLVLAFALSAPAFAAESTVLRFDENGEFKIFHLTDCQDTYPADEEMIDFINHVLEKYEPDLVVLGGDNTIGPGETKKEAIEELVAPFVAHEVPFTLVFGNHDREQGVSNAELLKLYQQAGGKYCLAYDAVPSLSGDGNHNLPIFSSTNPLKVAYNLYMFDSGTSGKVDANGNSGYECVYADQVEWFENTNEAYTALNGGKVIPSMVFQHIIVGEIMDAFYKEASAISVYKKFCNQKSYDLLFANYSVMESGFINEVPCPGVENHGQFDAMVRQGVVATFSGHDHMNSFTVNIDGVDVVNTPGATFHAYGEDYTRGGRIITLTEGTTDYKSDVLCISEEIMNGADINYSKFNAFFGVIINRIILAFFNLF